VISDQKVDMNKNGKDRDTSLHLPGDTEEKHGIGTEICSRHFPSTTWEFR
jgi:hypothetical protein